MAPPHTPLGELIALPHKPLAVFKRPTSKGKERQGNGAKGEEKGKERGGKGETGRERLARKMCEA